MHGKPVQTAVADTIASTAETLNPIGTSATLVQLLSPTVLDPLVQVSENKSFSGSPIYPETNPLLPQVPGHRQFFPKTGEISKEVSERLSKLTGGDKYRPGRIEISPNILDFLVEAYTGGPGALVNRSAQVVSNLLAGKSPPVHRIPFVRRFVGTEDVAHAGRKFREIYGEIVNIVEPKAKAGEALTPQERATISLKPMAEEIRKRMSARRDLEDSQATEAQKEEGLEKMQAEIQTMMKQFNRQFKELQAASTQAPEEKKTEEVPGSSFRERMLKRQKEPPQK